MFLCAKRLQSHLGGAKGAAGLTQALKADLLGVELGKDGLELEPLRERSQRHAES